MATKDELIRGLELLITEANRIADSLTEEQWARTVDLDGWKNVEVLAHLAGVGGMVVPIVGALGSQAPGGDLVGNLDIDQINAGMVQARAGKGARELAEEITKNYNGIIDFIRQAPDDLLQKRANAGGYRDLPVGDILVRMVVLHGLGHIYSVYSSLFFAERPA